MRINRVIESGCPVEAGLQRIQLDSAKSKARFVRALWCTDIHDYQGMYPVSDGWEITWNQLANSQNETADSLLVWLLDANDPLVVQRAVEILLQRRSKAGFCALLRRWPKLDLGIKELVRLGPSRLLGTLRDAVVSNDPWLFENACQAACYLHEYDMIPALITVAEEAANENGKLAAKTVFELSRLFHDELAKPRDYTNCCDPQLVRGRLLSSLENSVNRFRKHSRQDLVAAFLCLVRRDDILLDRLLSDPHDPAYLCVIDQLTHSTQVSVIRLLLSFLDTMRLTSSVINIVSRRSDTVFIESLLTKLQEPLSKTTLTNLKRVENIAWVTNFGFLAELDGEQQAALMRLVLASGMKQSVSFLIVNYLLEDGKQEGRVAAAQALDGFHGSVANHLALRAMSDPAPAVQVHAIHQIRQRNISDAMTRLLDFVDSDHELVREAARSCLPELSFERYLASFAAMGDAVRQNVGSLVFKVDPDALRKLVTELSSPVRSRRLRGLQVVQATEKSDCVEGLLLELLGDSDHLVRIEAVRALQWSTTPRALVALQRTQLDQSVAVQDAVKDSLIAVIRNVGTTSAAGV